MDRYFWQYCTDISADLINYIQYKYILNQLFAFNVVIFYFIVNENSDFKFLIFTYCEPYVTCFGNTVAH